MAGMTPYQRGFYQASGEATQQAPLPEKYEPTLPPASPISDHLPAAYMYEGDIRRAPIVQRQERTVGMRYLYARGMTRIPLAQGGHLAAVGGSLVRSSDFNQNDMGPIRNDAFNDKLFQAGYPGFNLGLSFKVPKLETNASGGNGKDMVMKSSQRGSNIVNALRRSAGGPGIRRQK